MRTRRFLARIATLGLLSLGPLLGGACAPWQIAAGVGGATLAGSYYPAHEIEQIYYIGSFDPRGQVPPEFYRITVRGQASLISNMKFGSGWVPAIAIDSLGGQVEFDPESGRPKVEDPGENASADITEGRGLIQFGPEGFRTAPREHRLVIVMGASPEAFFSAIDQSLGSIAKVQQVQRDTSFSRDLFAEYIRLSREHEQLLALEARIRDGIRAPGEGQ